MNDRHPSDAAGRMAIEATSALGFDETVAACREALATAGFGVLTEIDLAATLEAKLGVKGSPYLILGACHPPSAHQLIEALPAMGVLLPCNVVVSVEGDQTVVRAMDPSAVVASILRDPAVHDTDTVAIIETIADDIAGRLRNALASL